MKADIVTDTSTIAVFDLRALEHKVDAEGDWWTYAKDAELITELDAHRLYLIETGFDGAFVVTMSDVPREPSRSLECPSRRVYVTCGEELPGAGLRPELIRGGLVFDVQTDRVRVSHSQDGARIALHIWSEPDGAGNSHRAGL